MQKNEHMGDYIENWQNKAGTTKLKPRRNDEIALFIPKIKNETKEQRANRILSLMEVSSNRLNRLLEIFSRID